MVAHRTRDADASWRTFSLESCRHIHHVAMHVGAIWNHVSDVDTDAVPDRPIRGLVAIADGSLLLYPHGTTHCPVNAVEHDEQGVTCGIDDPTAVVSDRRVDKNDAKSPHSLKRPYIIQPNQTGVTYHISMKDGDQPSST